MELKIEITKKNVKQIARILPLLFGEEEEIVDEMSIRATAKYEEKTKGIQRYLSVPGDIKNLKPGNINTGEHGKKVGSWGQFNSYFPIKAVLRIIANLMIEKKVNSVDLNDIVNLCKAEFKKEELKKYRGFPISEKPSSIGRLVWHFITTGYEMGLINIEGGHGTGIPLNDWVGTSISISKEGYEFAVLPNKIFDMKEDTQILTPEEKTWLVGFLKRIDRMGYKEYTFLSEIYNVLKKGENIKHWLEENKNFYNYVKSWSRKCDSPEDLRKQVSNLAVMFSSSKIAILRELGVVRNKRNDYTVISDLD